MSYNKLQRWDYTPLTTDKNIFPTYDSASSGPTEILSAPGAGNCYHITGMSITNESSPSGPLTLFVINGAAGANRFKVRVPASDELHIKFPHTLEFPENTSVYVSGTVAYSVELFGWIGSPTS